MINDGVIRAMVVTPSLRHVVVTVDGVLIIDLEKAILESYYPEVTEFSDKIQLTISEPTV